MDLADLRSVTTASEELRRRTSRLDILGKASSNYDEGAPYLMSITVSNAATITAVKETVTYGWEKNMAVKYTEKFSADNATANTTVTTV
jgi:hypothetical protein